MRLVFAIVALFLVLALAGGPALGAEFAIDLGGQVEYDNNIFRTDDPKVEDVIFRLYPVIEFYEDRSSDLHYNLTYQMPLSVGVTESVVNGLDYIADFDSTWYATDRFSVSLDNHFAYVRSTLLRQDTTLVGAVPGAFGAPQLSSERARVLANTTDLKTAYQLTPRLTGTVLGTFTYFDPELVDRSTNYTGVGTGDLSYTLTPQHSIGGGVRFVYQRFLRSLNVVGSNSQFATGFGQWRWAIDDTTLFEVAVGPTWIQTATDFTRADAINAAVGGLGPPGDLTTLWGNTLAVASALRNTGIRKSSTLTAFANVSLSKRFTPNVITAVGYDRSQGLAGGLGGSVVRDAVNVIANWDVTERWLLSVRADYVIRSSVGRQVLTPLATTQSLRDTSSVNSDRYGVAGRITHRLTKRTDLNLQLTWNEQLSNRGTLGKSTDFSNFLATFGVNYSFDPIHAW